MAPLDGGEHGVPATGGRRRPEQVRRLILDAASTTFATCGYAGTTTRMIATRAGVSETLLFRHFGPKAALFEATVTEGFGDRVEEFTARWGRLQGSPEMPFSVEPFLRELCRFVRQHRDVLLVLLAVESFESHGELATTATARAITRLRDTVTRCVLTDGTGDPPRDGRGDLTASSVLALILGVATLDRPLFGEDADRPTESALDEEAVALVLHGVANRRHRSASSRAHGIELPPPTAST